MGDGNFRPPTESTPLDQSPKNLVQVITSAAPMAVTNLVGLLGKWVKYNEIFFYLYLFFTNSPTGQTRRRIFMLDGSTTRTRARMCLLGVSLTLLPILEVKSPENPNFWGVNRRFQAKPAKYWKFHVIETNASISTKFCTTIETNRNSSWVVPIGAQQIQDRGRPPFWKKPLNRYISASDQLILIRFGTVTHIGLLQRIGR